MRRTLSESLRTALNRADIPVNAQHEVYARVVGNMRRDKHHPDIRDPQWAALIKSARLVKLGVTSNRSKWSGTDVAPIYEEYASLVTKAIEKMEQARTTLGDDGKPLHLGDFTAFMRTLNQKRARDNKSLLGECNTRWQSWVPPAARDALIERAAMFYANSNSKGRGKRLVPFAPLPLRKENEIRAAVLHNQIATARQMVGGEGRASSPYKALLLVAARQAELSLREWEMGVHKGKVHVYLNPCPVSWQQLLTPALRARLKAGGENPATIDTFGLERFLDPRAVDAGDDLSVIAWVNNERAEPSNRVVPSQHSSSAFDDGGAETFKRGFEALEHKRRETMPPMPYSQAAAAAE